MQALYGKRWIDEWGPEPHPLWVTELSSMTPEEAAMGWRACKTSGDQWPPTLPVFLDRVVIGLKEKAARTNTHRALPSPPSSQDIPLGAMVEAQRDKGRKTVDVELLKQALGHGNVRIAPMRRTILRGELHPAGRCDLSDVQKAKGDCRKTGRSWRDMELELMAHNGWSPDDEDRRAVDRAVCRYAEPQESGDTPFLDAWRALK